MLERSNRLRGRATCACLALVLASTGLFAQAGSAAPVLKLRAGELDPAGRPSASGEPGAVRVVQFRAVPDGSVRRAVEARGARVLGFLPETALVVRLGDGAALSRVRGLPGHRWDGAIDAAWKVSPDLGVRPFADPARRAGAALLATVDLWPDADAHANAMRLGALGIDVRAVWTNNGLRRLLARGSTEQLRSAAGLEDVAWIEEHPEATLRNDAASWVIQSNVSGFRPIWDHGLHGEGQVLGNIDGKLDMSSCYFEDGGAPVGNGHRKVLAYRSNSGQGADSHGTHTNGTMAGDSGTWGVWDPGDGHAFAAKISFTNLSDITGSGSATSNLLDRLADAHADGARAHSNSWGDDGTTSYTTWSRDIDDFSWQFEDSLVLFAVTNGSSLKTPENAKNVLAVGATQRAGNADNHCSGGTGPTSDGRRKPEIYAPGCSTVSAAHNQACDTRGLTGTSMACPAVTGAAALVRQYFEDGWYPSGQPFAVDSLVPSGALVKAVLISGAEDMTGVAGYPSDTEGWGRVHLERSLFFTGDSRGLVVLDDLRRPEGLEAGQSLTYFVTVDDAAEPLRFTLAFTEPPAELMASSATVNDLDLEVEAPDGTLYLGNRTDGAGESIPGGSPDAINNLEQVLLSNAATGTYTVTVRATTVPVGPQGFALVATGGVFPATGPRLRYAGSTVVDAAPLGNDDGQLDPGETIVLPVTLANPGNEDATGITGELTVDRPEWVRITGRHTTWPDLIAGAEAGSIAPHFELVVSPDAPCQEQLRFTLTARSDQTADEISGFSIDVGDPNRDFAGPPLALPPFFFGTQDSTLTVAEDVVVREVDVSVDISHGDVGELVVLLISPSGSQVALHNRTRGGQQDLQVRYDRDRDPDGPGSLDDFEGEPALGTWTLAIGDNQNTAVPAGQLNGWTLHLTADRALTCHPLSCGDPLPGAVSGLRLERMGDDVEFSWDPVAGADGYHVLESESPTFDAPDLTGETAGATEFTESEGALGVPSGLTLYEIRAVNSCNWEGD